VSSVSISQSPVSLSSSLTYTLSYAQIRATQSYIRSHFLWDRHFGKRLEEENKILMPSHAETKAGHGEKRGLSWQVSRPQWKFDEKLHLQWQWLTFSHAG
jgi:hypothetical protein